MKPDSDPTTAAPTPMDRIEPANLNNPGGAAHVRYRYEASAAFTGLLQRF